ncbi:TIL domain-containing protein [Caenorhabditis elegans]|uniref:TIL domain-containing protein n=1 Tax=Caenorhabditis elegans TaxID=6239 RepID=Q9U1T5_CAEEL|nr:TIL domain-containing protein [Caenorhabditis elegans]CAB54473.2 TIL domain-containing protein [Caenorhabditis elegans]|eukprot:NP_507644.2 Uncharacterized protein CELE_Y69H2.3 [Caenorhabditis elegans]
MQYIVLLSVLLIGANAQLSATRDQECKENESFQTCGTACEPTCGLPTPTFCTLQCVMGCQCNSGFFRRTSDNRCVEQKDCNVAANETIPIPPPATNLTCPVNEVSNECHNPCTEKKCPQKNAPQVNCLMACQVGCSCMDGFVRNNQGVCVKEAECPAIGSQTCGTNEEPNQCHNACFEKKCPVKPQPLVNCMEKCDIGCSCKKGFLRNRQGQCVNPTECPATGSTLTCSKNEEPNDCHNSCSEAKCPVNPQPFVRCMMRCEKACSCKKGLVRNRQGQCVKLAECPPTGSTDENPCNLVDCRTGHQCSMSTGKPTCVPDYSDTPSPLFPGNGSDINIQITPCSTMKCSAGTECMEVQKNCTEPPCGFQGVCVNTTEVPVGGCATMRCSAGTTCQEALVKCAKAPCPSHAACIPNSNETLSSCAAVTCPVGEICTETLVQCFVEPCPPLVSCTPINSTVINSTTTSDSGCASVSCPVGERCEETTMACLMAPCPKAVSCVPMNGNQNSTARQGCDVVRCRANEVCEEQKVDCVKAPCPMQVACVSIVHLNSTTPAPGSTCAKNQTMSDCLNTCSEDKCPGMSKSMMCTKHCGQGCACASGYLRSSDGECYKPKDCPPECGQNEEYRCEKCAGTCKNPEPNCPGPKNKSCKRACICAPGFVKKNGKCVTLASCPDHDHTNITCLGTQEYTDCMPKCQQLCSGAQQCETGMEIAMCTPGCVCRPNYKLDSNGDCVHNRHCFKTTECPDNEEWSKCLSNDNQCDLASISMIANKDQCFSGCVCADGFARNNNGTCVASDKC